MTFSTHVMALEQSASYFKLPVVDRHLLSPNAEYYCIVIKMCRAVERRVHNRPTLH